MTDTDTTTTRYTIEAVDAICLFESLNRQSNTTAEMVEVGKGNRARAYLQFTVERYAMDANGFPVGYEKFTGRLPLHKKRDYCFTGLPWRAFPWAVMPKQVDVHKIVPATRNSKFYCKPDSDFAYQELEHVLQNAIGDMLEPEFDAEERTWSAGDKFVYCLIDNEAISVSNLHLFTYM